MGLTIGNAVCTPGTKEPNADYEATTNNETEFLNGVGGDDGSGKHQRAIDAGKMQCNRVSMVKKEALTDTNGQRTSTRHVTVKEETEQREVRRYATIGGVHPSLIKSTRTGMVQMQTPCNPYTAKSARIMRRRRLQEMRGAAIAAHTHRMRQLMRANHALRSERRSER